MVISRTVRRYDTLAHVLIFYLGSALVLALTAGLTKNLPGGIANAISVFSATVLTLLLVFIFTRLEKRSLQETGLAPGKKSIVRFAAGYAAGLLMAVVQALIVQGTGHLRLIFVSHLPVWEMVLSFFLYLFAAGREEVVFRSYLLRSLDTAFGSAVALLIMTAFFILEHIVGGMNWAMALIGSGMGGILFGVSALKSKGLALPWGLHSAWNFGQWLMGFKGKAGVWEAVVEKGYEKNVERTGLAAFVLAMVVAIAVVLVIYRKENSQAA